MILSWKNFSNLENSLYEFLEDAINVSGSIQVLDDNGEAKDISLKIGYTPDDTWELPCIAIFEDNRLAPRGFIGSNKRIKTSLVIIDIRGLNDQQRSILADWVEETINAGFTFYEYSPSSNPDDPDRVEAGHVAVEFLSNAPLRIDSADLMDKYKQRISISCYIEGD